MGEQNQTPRRYKMGMAVRESGVTPQTIRFYEKEGLIQSQKESFSTTRYFGVRQLKQISNIRRYFRLGFSEAEVRTLMDSTELPQMHAVFAEKARQTARELEELTLRLRLLEEMTGQLERIGGLVGHVEEAENPALCFLITRRGDQMIETQAVNDTLASWVDKIHLTALGSVIPRAIFLEEPHSNYRLSGVCVPEEDLRHMAGGTQGAELMHIPPQRCLHTACRLDGDDISPRTIMPEAYAALARCGYRVCGDVFGRAIAVVGESALNEKQRPLATYYEYWIPVGG